MAQRQAKNVAGLNHLPAVAPGFVDPMKARLVKELPGAGHWLFEVKLDGIRALAVKDGPTVWLFSRRPRDITADYPTIAEAVRALPVRSAVLDGEIVILDAQGRTSFQGWQNFRNDATGRAGLRYYIFDLLQVEGRAVTGLPLAQRRASLELILNGARAPLAVSPLLEGSRAEIWKRVKVLGLEGVIAKQRDSTYESGRRSGAWLKIKRLNSQEFVLGGYTAPQGSRPYFGAVLVGVYDGKRLLFVSRVGTGFNHELLGKLHGLFQKHVSPTCPFVNLPTRRVGRSGQGVTAADMRQCTWLKPKLVCQVEFLEWTGDDSLRQPVFLGLRDDKRAEDVVREAPA